MNNTKPVVLVDIDGTLCKFDINLYNALKQLYPKIKTPDKWTWNFWKNAKIPSSVFYDTVDEVHKKQLEYEPFDKAKELLELLSNHYYIIIASHRKKDNYHTIQKWLNMNNLPYDEIFCDYDKTILLEHFDVQLIIDDSPKILEEAILNEIPCIGIKYKWNEAYIEDAILMDSLSEIYHKLIKEIQ